MLEPIESNHVLGLMADFYRAGAYLNLKNLSKAESLYYNVIDKIPSAYPRAYYQIANIMSLRNRTSLSHYYLGLFYNEIKDIRKARLHLSKALEKLDDPDKIQKAKKLLEQN
jgi:tetratricopeptide (TPR) repeat protein